MPKWRQVRATLRDDSPARCNTFHRHAHNRVCSAFVIASPSSIRPTKTLLTLPSPWTHRTRPQGLGNYRTVSTAPTALILCRKTSTQEESSNCQPCLGISQHGIPDTWVTLLPLRRGHALEGVSRHGRAAAVWRPPARGREDGAPLRRVRDLAEDGLQDFRSVQGLRRAGLHGPEPAAVPAGQSTAAAA